jgi:hypothetical protein
MTVMIRINNFLALISLLSFIVLLRIESSSFSNDFSEIAFRVTSIALFFFGSIYLFHKYRHAHKSDMQLVDGMNGCNDRIKETEGSITKLLLLTAPAYLLIGLGVYGLFGQNTGYFLRFLHYPWVSHGLIAFGLIAEVAIFFRLIPLWKKQASTHSKDI